MSRDTFDQGLVSKQCVVPGHPCGHHLFHNDQLRLDALRGRISPLSVGVTVPRGRNTNKASVEVWLALSSSLRPTLRNLSGNL